MDAFQHKTQEPDHAVRLSRHSRSLSGLSGSSVTLSLTPLSDDMRPVDSAIQPGRSSAVPLENQSQFATLGVGPSRLPYSRERSHYEQEGENRRLASGLGDASSTKKLSVRRSNAPNACNAVGGVGPIRSKKQKGANTRERIQIALAPDQPPTTQGKQRERVFVACRQW